MTHNHSLGSDAVYLLQAFKGHGVHLAFQELGVERVYMGFEARYIYLSAVLSLHFVSVMKSRSEPQPISPTITRGGGKRRGAYSSSGVKSRRSSMWSQTLRRFTPSTSFFASGRV